MVTNDELAARIDKQTRVLEDIREILWLIALEPTMEFKQRRYAEIRGDQYSREWMEDQELRQFRDVIRQGGADD